MLRFFKFKLAATVAIATFVVSCSGRSSREPAQARTPVAFRGLEGLALDQWTLGFFGEPSTDASFPGRVKDLVIQAVEQNPSAASLYAALLAQRVNRNYPSYTAYKGIADGILSARKTLRRRDNLTESKQISALLQLLLEETLYVAGLKYPERFPDSSPYYRANFGTGDATACQADGKIRMGQFVGMPVCSGDVLVTKGGAGSSSFLARFADHPANFSHSFVPHVAADTKKVTLFESLIEDGAKLRPASDYETGKPSRKLAFYRYAGPDRRHVLETVIKAADTAYANFNERAVGRDAFKNPAFPYDFAMDASGPQKDERLFCSEIPIYIYSGIAGLDDTKTPYASAYWSTVSGATRSFFEKFLEVPGSRVPAPSDVEQNPAYEMTGLLLAPRQLGQDRVDVALIDLMVTRMNDRSEKLEGFFSRIDAFGEGPLTPADIAFLKRQPWIPEAAKPKLDAGIPEGINKKQLAFFVTLNEVVVPQVRQGAAAYEKKLWDEQKRPAGLLELRAVVETIAVEVLGRLEQQIGAARP